MGGKKEEEEKKRATKCVACLIVAEHYVEFRLYLLAAVACKATVSEHLQHARSAAAPPPTETAQPLKRKSTASTFASSLLRACSARIFLPNSSTRLFIPASSATAGADAAAKTSGCGLDTLASSLDILREPITRKWSTERSVRVGEG
jgi:hypothetical protein